MTQKTALLVIYNPVCGHGEAPAIFEGTVLPILRDANREPDKIIMTTHAGHAGQAVLEFLQQTKGPVDIVLGSGDGTLHEILSVLYRTPATEPRRDIIFALVPCGTANALFSSLFPITPFESEALKLSKIPALRALLNPTPQSRPLRLAQSILLPSLDGDTDASRAIGSSLAAVVTSTALHAGILHDSESLRATMPSLDRFKIAAQRNITKWYHARARLFTVTSSTPAGSLIPGIEIFDPTEGSFVSYHGDGATHDGGIVELEGPFAYFVSTVNVDRLEPSFRITPSQVTFPPAPTSTPAVMDLVVVRPLRDPSVMGESDEARERFSHKTMAVMAGAYRNGAHVSMRYGPEGAIVEGQADGDTVVEYFRCHAWEWIPVSDAMLDLLGLYG
jgi:hypothetical protein